MLSAISLKFAVYFYNKYNFRRNMDKFTELLSKLTDHTKKSGSLEILENEPMKNHTSFKIGGPARIFAIPGNVKTLAFVLESAREAGVRTYVLGRGTNVLFDDEGYDGIVISTAGLTDINVLENEITCGAGASFTAVSKTAYDNSLDKMTFANGIPGSVGGAVYMNAGAYNGEVANILKSSTYLDLNNGEIYELPFEDHEFSYRYSSYKSHPERVILSATFSLEKGDKESIKAEMDDFMNRRRTKQPLEMPSAGSVFKRYPGRYTAQMIDEAGLKGVSVGGACVSEKHAGFIVNKGGATSDDVLTLIDIIKNKIREMHGIDIETEIIYVK